MARSARLLLLLAFLAALLAIVLQLYRFRKPRLWTAEELSRYNGTDEGLPILLGILGSVFDVTKGRSHYGPGGGYHHFAGRDASRAFVSGNFTGDGLTDSLQGLSSMEVNSIVDWRKMYFEKYMPLTPPAFNIPEDQKEIWIFPKYHTHSDQAKCSLQTLKCVVVCCRRHGTQDIVHQQCHL